MRRAMKVSIPFRIEITRDRQTSRNRVVELTVHPQKGGEPFLAVMTLYGAELYVNLPANNDANRLLESLQDIFGIPSAPPVVKCSGPWNEMMIGPMQTSIWHLEEKQLNSLRDLIGDPE
jgi:hypothetical protein